MLKSFSLVILVAVFHSQFSIAMEIDGVLDEEEWSKSEVVENLYTVKPFTTKAPALKTIVKFYHNADGMFVGITNFQDVNTQRVERLQRDAEIFGDKNEIIVDFDGNKQSGYGFEISNGGTMRDGIWSNERQYSIDWDGNWQSATTSTSNKWISEIFIPWDAVPMTKAKNNERKISIYFSRRVAHLGEQYASSPISNDRAKFLSEMPNMVVPNYSNSAIKVFLSGVAKRDIYLSESESDVGLDVFWMPNGSSQVSLTINPDFSQVESDNLVVNFSPEETFFEEKRPFFTENQSVFNTAGMGAEGNDLRLVHTRRIGITENGGKEELTDINGAVKVTSNGSDFSYGLMAVSEDGQWGAEVDSPPLDTDADNNTYFVGKASYGIGPVTLGYLGTRVEKPNANRVSMTNTIDYQISLLDDLRFRGEITQSDLRAPSEGEEYSQKDYGASSIFEWQVNPSWRNQIEITYFGDDFEVNDLGFLSRNNERSLLYYSDRQNPSEDNSNSVKNTGHKLWVEYAENLQGVNLAENVELQNYWQFKDTSAIFINSFYYGPSYDDLLTRGNNILEKDAGYLAGYYYEGVQRRRFRFTHLLEYTEDSVEGRGINANLFPTFFFTDSTSLTLGIEYTSKQDWLIWQQANDVYSYDREQVDLSIAANQQIGDKHEFRLKLQWLSLNAKGNEAYQIAGSGGLDTLTGSVEDFSLYDTALQLRYRYELGPLSSVYIVYSKGGQLFLDNQKQERLLGSFDEAWDETYADSFIFKIRYLF